MKQTNLKLLTLAILLSLTTEQVQAMRGEPAKENNLPSSDSMMSNNRPNGKPLPPPPGFKGMYRPETTPTEASAVKESAPSPTTVTFDALTQLAPTGEAPHDAQKPNIAKAIPAPKGLELTPAQQAKKQSVGTRRSYSQALSNKVNNAASKAGSFVGLTKGTIKRTTTDPKTGKKTVTTTDSKGTLLSTEVRSSGHQKYDYPDKQTTYHPNGKIQSETVRNSAGIKTTTYDSDGTITSTGEYSRDRRANITLNYKDGKPSDGTFRRADEPAANIKFTDTNGSYTITGQYNKVLEQRTIAPDGLATTRSYNERYTANTRVNTTIIPSLDDVGANIYMYSYDKRII